MTVDRTHVLATPGMDAHGSYVALSPPRRHGPALWPRRLRHQDKLVNTLSRDRAKDMATDYEPAQAMPSGAASPSAPVMPLLNDRVPSNAVDRIGDIIFSVRELRDGAGAGRDDRQRIKQEIEAVAQDAE
jgi:hypothetical protein